MERIAYSIREAARQEENRRAYEASRSENVVVEATL
jgi:hypothetical protein